jgi:acyl transferase domain-containing protein/acyl carrier protein
VNSAPSSKGMSVAIVGIGCRFPGGATDPASLWELLNAGADAITEIPPSRINLNRYYDARPATPGRMMTRWGGFLDGIEDFDADFFGISPREAERLDPQQRLLLETAWEALEDAGQDMQQLEGTRTGVFVGQWLSDFEARLFANPDTVDFYMTTGSGRYAASGRVSYAFGLRGPSLTLDTACSSSLVAIHLAAQSVWSGESEMAIAGGANTILQPHISIAYSQSRMMAPDGRCKFGDARGDGYVRSEGAGVVVLKSLDRALTDGDRIYAVIRGSAVNNDGSSGGSLGTPSRSGQEELLRRAYKDAGCSAAKVGYVEAHGTGTRAGDPIELGALGAVLGEGRAAGFKALVGSIKTNFGHTEGAAGVAGLIKTVLALHHRRIPASLHCADLNPAIDWNSAPYRIAREATTWEGDLRLAGVSAFGITGTNAHVVLEQAPDDAVTAKNAELHDDRKQAVVLALSARSPVALRDAAARYANLLGPMDDGSLGDVCWSAAIRRTSLNHRIAFVARSCTDLVDQLRQQASETAVDVVALPDARPRIVFVCPGQGAQWHGMARELYSQESIFRAALDHCDVAARPWLDVSIVGHLLEDGGKRESDRIDVIQPTLVALAIAYGEFWRSLGVEPDALVGHSMGEVAAAHLAGVLDLDQAMRIVCRRSALMRRTSGQGAMAMVDLSMRDAQRRLRGREQLVSVAVGNSPRASVISGSPEAVAEVLLELDRDQIFNRLIKVDVASHSPQMEALAKELSAELSDLQPSAASTALYSTVTAAPVSGSELDAAYWGKNLRQPVRFGDTVALLAQDGMSVFIELGPHPILVSAIEQTAQACERDVLAVGSGHREEGDGLVWRSTAARLWAAGVPIRWDRVMKPGRYVALPTYSWQRERHWGEAAQRQPGATMDLAEDSPRHPLLQRRFDPATGGSALWETQLSGERQRIYLDHRVGNDAVFPAAGFVELVLAAARNARGEDQWALADVKFHSLLLLSASGLHLQVRIEWSADDRGDFEVHGKRDRTPESAWVLHASGTVHKTSDGATTACPPVSVLGARHLDSDALQRLFTDTDLHYGPGFRLVEYLDVGERSATGRLFGAGTTSQSSSDEREPPANADGYFAYPPTLDAALQALLACVLENFPPSPLTWVPVSIGAVRLIDRLEAGRSYAVAVALSEDRKGERSGDVVLQDESGRVLASLAQVRFATLGNTPVVSTGRLLYELKWEPSTLDVTKTIPVGAPVQLPSVSIASAEPLDTGRSDSPTKWSALADRRGVGAALGSILGPSHGENLAFCGSDDLRASLEALMRRTDADGTAAQGIVHLWSLDALPPDAPGGSLAAARDIGCLSALALVQVVASSKSARRRRLCLVTAGAQAVLDGEIPAIEQAPLWGLGRVIANEHPEFACTLIDLSSSPSPQEIDALARELNAETSDEQIAIRGKQRFVARLVPTQLTDVVPAPPRPAADRPYRVRIDTPGILDGLVLHSDNRTSPGFAEVEIEVESTGLNFMNVMSALGIYPGYPNGVGPLGIECAGRITEIGAGAGGLRIGDKVMAVVFDSLASHCIADARLVRQMPAVMSFTEASSIPVAFLTAYYALHSLARIEPGERVLVHAATGGVGLAAIQLVRLAGAEPFATAGTDEKRALLKRMGVAHVMDSRSLAFREQVMERTGGKGVDVVLNSLAGDFIPASLAVLAPHGRFVELGKVDIYRNSRVGLSPFQRNLSFFAVDLDRMIRDRPASVAKIFDELMALVESGAIQPLPSTAFSVSRAAEAFRLMANAGHIGKIVITGRDPEARIVEVRGDPLGEAAEGTCVITGGLGGLGLAVARRWIERGGRSIALMARTGANAAQASVLQSLEAAGATVRSFAVDVASDDQVGKAFADIHATMPAISTVIHAAGILEDGMILQQSAATFARAMAPKVEGAWNLHKALEDAPSVNLVLFSSVASLLGLPGQSNYAAGNAFLDSLSAYRRAKGGRATVINWGPWKDIGLAAAQAIRGGRLASGGLNSLDPAQALDELERILVHSPSQLVAMDMDWRAYSASNPGSAKSPFLSEVSPARPADAAARPEARARDIFTAAASGTPRRAAIELFLKEQVARVLRQATGRIDAGKPFRSLGLDSLMGLELRNRLEAELSLQLPASVVWNYPTVKALAPHLASLLGIPIDAPPSHEVVAAPASSAEEIDSLLHEIENLAGDEVRRLLELDETPGLSK